MPDATVVQRTFAYRFLQFVENEARTKGEVHIETICAKMGKLTICRHR